MFNTNTDISFLCLRLGKVLSLIKFGSIGKGNDASSLENCRGKSRFEFTDADVSDSPETAPGSVLHLLGRALLNFAIRLRGPRRRLRLRNELPTSHETKIDAGSCRALRGAARS